MQLTAMTSALLAQADTGSDYGFIWLVVGVLAIIALIIFIIRGR